MFSILMELTGYFDFYPEKRVQLMGRTEISYAAALDSDMRQRVFSRICQPDTPCILISRGLPVPEELTEAAAEAHTPILISNDATTYLMSMVTQYLAVKLAVRTSIHGVLVEVFGMGGPFDRGLWRRQVRNGSGPRAARAPLDRG
jgi:HPr kinase/phosphorylase